MGWATLGDLLLLYSNWKEKLLSFVKFSRRHTNEDYRKAVRGFCRPEGKDRAQPRLTQVTFEKPVTLQRSVNVRVHPWP